MSQSLAIAAIQSISVRGDIAENAKRHLRLAKIAAKHGATFVLFPEFSLTGYEQAIAHEIAIGSDDPRLDDLRRLAKESNMTIVVGVPIVADSGKLQIAALSLKPDASLAVYTKQHLHSGETEVFTPGDGGELLDIHGTKVAVAVCADISQPCHAERAIRDGASVYAASVLITDNGYKADTDLLKRYAENHQMAVIMANHGGITGGWKSAGRSAIWDAVGSLIVAAPGDGECIVMAERKNANWHGRVLAGDA
jgi:predicted amidohydrolase